MAGYAIALATVLGVNLLPAFGPPTWAVLVFFRLNSDLPAVPLVLGGALAAACGRLLLASGSGRVRGRLSPKRRESLRAVEERITRNRSRTVAGLALFALSPVPSGQLFVTAGLLGVRLLPLTAAFFAGRLVSYSIYVTGASLAKDSLEGVLARPFASPVAIAVQVAMLVGLVALVRVDWTRVLSGRGRPQEPRHGATAGR
jgi:uncharacterized membrane protein YdjX (TVP38/TMEM64 family)